MARWNPTPDDGPPEAIDPAGLVLYDARPLPRPRITPTESSSLAGWSMWLGFFSVCWGFTAIPAVICGIVALRYIEFNPHVTGGGKAKAGIICGATFGSVWLLGWLTSI